MVLVKKKYFLQGLFLASILMVTIFSIWGLLELPNLQTRYSLQQFLPLTNPLLKRDQEIRNNFQLSNTQPFFVIALLSVTEKTWLTNDKIATLKQLTETLQALSGVASSVSIATVPGAATNSADLQIGPLLTILPEKKWQDEISKNPLVTPTLISADYKTVSLIIYPEPLEATQLKALREKIEHISRSFLPFANIQLGGAPAIQSDVASLLQSEIKNFVVLGFLGSFLVLVLIFKNFSPLFISIAALISANVVSLAVISKAGYAFSVLSSTIPILLSVDVISLCLHSFLRFTEERKKHPQWTHRHLVIFCFKKLFLPNLIASITTTIGFVALMNVNAPIIKDFGWTASLAVLIGWLVTTALLFPLLFFLPPPVTRSWAAKKARWSLLFFRQPSMWVGIIVFASVGLAFIGNDLSWSARLFDDLPQKHAVRETTELIDKSLGGMVPFEIQITGSDNIWSNPKELEKLDKALDEIREIQGVQSAVGLPDLIAATNLSSTRLPSTQEAVAETVFLYSLSSSSPLKNYLSPNLAQTRLAIRTLDLPADELTALIEKIETLLAVEFPDARVLSSGVGATIPKLNNLLSHELIFGFWQSMAAIFIVLLLVLKSFRWALLACIPNLVPPAVLLGFLALTQTPIKPSVAIIFSIALGLAFNNTVYILERLRSEQKKSSQKDLKIVQTLLREGNPCLLSTLTLLAGFSVFLVSYFDMNRLFGVYMILSMLAGLVGDLVLLPTLLKIFPEILTFKFRRKNKSVFASLALSLFLWISPTPTLAQTSSIEQIKLEMKKRLQATTEEFNLTMKIIEPDGASKERSLHIWRHSPQEKEHSLLARMKKPLDLKGTAVLATLSGTTENKWIYLPSTKQTRRLATTSGDSGLLGSELSAEDFDFNSNKRALSVLKKELTFSGKKYFLIESDVQETSTSYSKIQSYVSAQDFLPVKIECFDKKGQLLKVLDFSNYKKVGGEKWRAGKIKIKNVQNKRGTDILVSDVKIGHNLKASLFRPQALAED